MASSRLATTCQASQASSRRLPQANSAWGALRRRVRSSATQLSSTQLVLDYVVGQPQLQRVTGGSPPRRVEPLLDGVINWVYGVHGQGWSLLLKQAPPYVRAVGESFPLSVERMAAEAAALQWMEQLCPARVPQLLLYDAQQSVMATSWVPAPHQQLVEAIQQGQVYPELGAQLSELLGSYLLGSSVAAIGPGAHAAAVERFARNAQTVAVNREVVLEHPFVPFHASNRWSPELDAAVAALWADEAAMGQVRALQHVYDTRHDVLIHNDLHTGNLLVAPGSLYLLDWEFATMGPAAFDLGTLFASLLLAALSLPHLPPPDRSSAAQRAPSGGATWHDHRQRQRRWLLQVVQDVWESLCARASAAAQDLQPLLSDSVGFAACCLVRQTIGLHHYAPIRDLPDHQARLAAERRCLALGHRLLRRRHTLASMRDVVQLAEQCCCEESSAGADGSTG